MKVKALIKKLLKFDQELEITMMVSGYCGNCNQSTHLHMKDLDPFKYTCIEEGFPHDISEPCKSKHGLLMNGWYEKDEDEEDD